MHWTDQIAQDIIKNGKYQPYWVDDMKTPSGRIHVGALRGVLIHDLVFKALQHQGVNIRSTYVFNDMDPMDALPNYLDPNIYQPLMGTPVYQLPAPDGKSANFAKQYADDFIDVFTKLGAIPEIVWSHELYESGQMNEVIKTALDLADKVREVYQKVAKQQRLDNWFPFQPICPKCGKVGTTNTDGWDGKNVHFKCEPNLVKWAIGCGYEGEISPFNGSGKLMWKIDWPAHWKVIGVTIEGAGKDHSSEGGSRDIAAAILKNVYHYPEPYDIPYEWFVIGGKKMSSSKGVGTSAREFVDMLPPELGRFLFVKTKYNRHLDFDPNGNTIPDLFDEYDRMAQEYWSGKKSDYARTFELSQIKTIPHKLFMPRFRDIARMIQDPKINLTDELTKQKGSALTEKELDIITERIKYARIWINCYAPNKVVFNIHQNNTVNLTSAQKQYLMAVRLKLESNPKNPDLFQQELYQLAKSLNLAPKDAFGCIYQILIGKTHGPKAAWLLIENRDIAMEKISNLENTNNHQIQSAIRSTPSNRITLNPTFSSIYPSASVGYAYINGVTIRPFDKGLEMARQQFLSEVVNLTTAQLNQFPELVSYRKMYKNMGVEWHSKRPSPEALLRRIATGKGLYPPINSCVDAYNLVVMKHRISAGAFDADKLKFPVTVKIAQGGETGFFIGDKEDPTVIKPGEVCYFDNEGPFNIDYNYRDAITTAVTTKTKNLWINTEGIYDISPDQVNETLEDTISIILKYCGGTVIEKGMLLAQ